MGSFWVISFLSLQETGNFSNAHRQGVVSATMVSVVEQLEQLTKARRCGIIYYNSQDSRTTQVSRDEWIRDVNLYVHNGTRFSH